MHIPYQPLSRRRFITTGLAAAGALQLVPQSYALPGTSCLLTPEQEVGPFYVAHELLRSSIAEGKPGVRLRLRIVLFNQATCAPLRNAAVDLWHCDAMGLYSGFTASKDFGPPDGMPPDGIGPADFDPSHGPPPGPPPGSDPSHALGPRGPGGPGGERVPTDKLTFLRGIQITGADGAVTYDTIFPGFYQGRVNHIHFKVRMEGHRSGHTYEAGHVSHTGQVFFPEELSLHLMGQPPYATHAIHRTTMQEDHVFNEQHGALATIHPLNPAEVHAGFVGEYRGSVDPSAVPAEVRMGPPMGRAMGPE